MATIWFFMIVKDLSIENFDLSWLQAPSYFGFCNLVIWILDNYISIILVTTINKMKSSIMINAPMNCFLSYMRKEILAFSFQYVVFYSVRKNNLIDFIWNFTHKLVSPFSTKNLSNLLWIWVFMNVKDSYNLASKFPATCNLNVKFLSSSVLRINYDIKNFIVLLRDCIKKDLLILLLFYVDDSNLSFRDDSDILIS